MKKYLAMFLIIICSSFSVFGEEGQNKEINDLRQRIEQLERESKDKDEKINKLLWQNDFFLIQKEGLEEKIEDKFKNYETSINATLDKRDSSFVAKVIGEIIGVLLILGLSYLGLINYIKERIKNSLDNFLKVNKDKIEEIIDEKNEEKLIRKSKKIVVVFKEKRNLKIENYENIKYVHYLNFDILNEDIMVIDDLQNEFLSSELIELYNKSNNKSILHYINGNSHIFKSENVYCANNKVTFYTHLMNILKYT